MVAENFKSSLAGKGTLPMAIDSPIPATSMGRPRANPSRGEARIFLRLNHSSKMLRNGIRRMCEYRSSLRRKTYQSANWTMQ